MGLIPPNEAGQNLLRKIADIFTTLTIFAILAVFVAWISADLENEYGGMLYIVDGDTVILGNEKIRLEGIDAPEMDQICSRNGVKYNCGRSSRENLRQLARKGTMRCKAWQRDKYERLLGRCFIGDLDVNSRMVSDGWALSFGGYFSEEAKAMKNGKGMWDGKFQRPRDWRKFKAGGTIFDDVPHDNNSKNLWWKFW